MHPAEKERERSKVRLLQNELPNADDNEPGQRANMAEPGQNDARRREQWLKKMLAQIEKERKQIRNEKQSSSVNSNGIRGMRDRYAYENRAQTPGDSGLRPGDNFSIVYQATLATTEVVVIVVDGCCFFCFSLFFFANQCRIAHITGNEKRRSIASCI